MDEIVRLAVQPLAGWRELWLLRKQGGAWSVQVLPPAATNPDTGYAEIAGWVPGGQQLLVAREAAGDGRYRRNFEVLDIDSLVPARQAPEPGMLGAFQRWQDPLWKQYSLAGR